MLTKVTDAKATEAELDKLVTADFSNNPALVPCTMKYAAEGTDMTVRLACVRAVGRCKVNSKAVLDGLEKLITDRSVELRVEAALIQNDLKNMK